MLCLALGCMSRAMRRETSKAQRGTGNGERSTVNGQRSTAFPFVGFDRLHLSYRRIIIEYRLSRKRGEGERGIIAHQSRHFHGPCTREGLQLTSLILHVGTGTLNTVGEKRIMFCFCECLMARFECYDTGTNPLGLIIGQFYTISRKRNFL